MYIIEGMRKDKDEWIQDNIYTQGYLPDNKNLEIVIFTDNEELIKLDRDNAIRLMERLKMWVEM